MPLASTPAPPRADAADTADTADAADPAEYAVIHRAIRSAGYALAAAAETISVADGRRLQAYLRYWNGHTGEILSHHGIEDTIFFPALCERVPSTVEVLTALDREHHELDRLMLECTRALDRVVDGAAPTAAVAALRRLADVMDDHLELEDREVVPRFAEHFSRAEYAALTKAAGKQIGLGKQAAFTVPYIGYWAEPEERAALLGQAPVPFRILYRLTRRGHGRLADLALGPAGR
jgi:hemerythrin-like domain-containing protein